MASETIPKQCKAGVVVNEGPNFKIEVQLVDVPTPAPDEVLLRLNATGLCMSDVHFMLGDWGLPPMSTFGVQCAGHEGAGVVVAVGDAVKDWKVGDRGGVKPLWDVCGNCELCYTGKENYCQKGVYTGLMKQGCVILCLALRLLCRVVSLHCSTPSLQYPFTAVPFHCSTLHCSTPSLQYSSLQYPFTAVPLNCSTLHCSTL